MLEALGLEAGVLSSAAAGMEAPGSSATLPLNLRAASYNIIALPTGILQAIASNSGLRCASYSTVSWWCTNVGHSSVAPARSSNAHSIARACP